MSFWFWRHSPCWFVVVAKKTTTTGPGSSTSDATTTATSGTGAATGELIYAIGSMGGENFDFLGGMPPAWTQITNERLIRYNLSNEPEGYYPMLAEKWEFAPDYTYMDIYLRQGVQWQGGYGELTADDVKYTFDLQADPANGSQHLWWFGPPAKGGFIKSNDVIDKYHFRFTFSALPNPAWLANFCLALDTIQCKQYVEKVGVDKAKQEPIGTGPWKLIEHVRGSYMKFEAFDQYWGKKPGFKYLTIKSAPEAQSQIAMLQSGEADVIGISPADIAQVEAAGLRTSSVPEADGVYVLFGGQLLSSDPKFDATVPWASHTDEPADSAWNQRALKVREALNLAINREGIRSKIMHGACTPMTTWLWPESIPGYKSEWKDIPYDPAQAKQLLSEAGYPNGFAKPITMYVDSGTSFGGATGKETALQVVTDLQAIGLKVDVQMIDKTGFSKAWYGHEDAWHMTAKRLGVYPDPTVFWSYMLASNGATHEAFASPAFDKIVADYGLSITKSQEERTAIAQSGQDYIYNNYMFAPIAFTTKVLAVGPKVKEIPVYEKYLNYTDPGVTFSYVEAAK